ncbi:MAG: hypothetical protein ACREEW_00205 [Caulobacteraceae bacterium]
MKTIVGVVLAAAALAACASQPLSPLGTSGYGPPPSANAFRASDFAWSTAPGDGRIDGVLTYRGPEGRRFTCKGKEVVLAPETPWSRARMRTLYLSDTSAALPVAAVRARTSSDHAAEYARFARTTTCNVHNRFAFAGLPNGAWYAITVATPLAGGEEVAVMRRVVTHGDDVEVTLR